MYFVCTYDFNINIRRIEKNNYIYRDLDENVSINNDDTTKQS